MQAQQSPGPSVAAVIFGPGDNHVGGGSAGGTSAGKTDNTKNLVNAMAKDIRSQRIVLALGYGIVLQMLVFISLHTLFAYPGEEATEDGDKKSAEVDIDVNKERSFGLGSFFFSLGTTVLGSVVRRFVAPFLNINFVGLAFASCVCTVIIGYRMQAQEHVCASLKEYVSSFVSCRLWLEVCVFGILASFMTNCYIHAFNWAPKNVTFLSTIDDEHQGTMSLVFINEKYLFIYLVTFATGVYIYAEWSRGFKGGFTLEFPTVPLKQVEVIRNSVIDLFSQTITEMISALPSIYFGVYMTYRLALKPVVEWGYSVHPDDELTLVIVGLWIRVGFLCCLITYIFQLLYVVVQVTMTEELGVSLASVFSTNQNQLFLTDAMNCKDIYLQHLGFHTFKMSANPFRRGVSQFYELSHPGSHPRNWTSICTATLQACDLLCKELTADLFKLKSSSSSTVKPPEKKPGAYLVTSPIQLDKDKIERNGLSPRYRGDARSPSIRFLAPTSPSAAPAAEEDSASYLRIVLTSPWMVLSTIASKLKEVLMKRFTFVLRLKETWERPKPELALSNIVSSYQLVLWGVNGLVEIILMSQKMDTHGVVQKDMSKILQKFVDLYKTSGKVISDRRLPSKSTAKVEMISQAAFYAIAKIHVRFGEHYEMLRVNKDYQIYAADIAKMEARRELTDLNFQAY